MSEPEKNMTVMAHGSLAGGPNQGALMLTPAIDGGNSSVESPAAATSQPGSGSAGSQSVTSLSSSSMPVPAGTTGNAGAAVSSSSSAVQQQQHHHPHVYPSMYKDTTFTKIFVGGLPYHTSDNTLREYFEVFGDIEEAVVITDRQTAKSRGYGFVTMLDRSSAERACKEPNPIIDGRKANVNLAYLGAKPRTNGIAALHARAAAAASYAPFLQSPLGYPSPYMYPSPILISPNLFLPNNTGHLGGVGGGAGGHHPHSNSAVNHHHHHHNGLSSTSGNLTGGGTTAGGGGGTGSPNSSNTSPSPVNSTANGQSYYDFSTAAALAAAASSFVQQQQYGGGPPPYAAFGDPSALYGFAPYAAAAGLLQNGGFNNGGLLHHQPTPNHGSSPSSNSNLYNGLSGGGLHQVMTPATLRGDK